MMVATKSLQIHIPLPSALCQALTSPLQSSHAQHTGASHPFHSWPPFSQACGHACNEGSTSPPALAGCLDQLSSGSLVLRNKRLLGNSGQVNESECEK